VSAVSWHLFPLQVDNIVDYFSTCKIATSLHSCLKIALQVYSIFCWYFQSIMMPVPILCYGLVYLLVRQLLITRDTWVKSVALPDTILFGLYKKGVLCTTHYKMPPSCPVALKGPSPAEEAKYCYRTIQLDVLNNTRHVQVDSIWKHLLSTSFKIWQWTTTLQFYH
jgi:hypothetical protein